MDQERKGAAGPHQHHAEHAAQVKDADQIVEACANVATSRASVANRESDRSAFSYIAQKIRELKGTFTRQESEQVKRARLEEAEWWEHLVGAVNPDHPAGNDPDCMYCQRMAELRAALAKSEADGRGK